jgi:cell wall assembly regulator SMI1
MLSRDSATTGQISLLEGQIGHRLPADYVTFMRRHDGGEWDVGGKWFVTIWPSDDVARKNADYELQTYLPEIFAFGGNGGSELFCFDFRPGHALIAAVPMAFDADFVAPIARSFTGFLKALEDGWEVGDPPLGE